MNAGAYQAIGRERPWMDGQSVTGKNTFTLTPTDNLMSPIHLRMSLDWGGTRRTQGKSQKSLLTQPGLELGPSRLDYSQLF